MEKVISEVEQTFGKGQVEYLTTNFADTYAAACYRPY